MLIHQAIRFVGKELVYVPAWLNYWLQGLAQKDTLSRCRLLPCSAHPDALWTKLDFIKYNGWIEASRQGKQFCSGDKWSFPDKHLRHSVFEDVSEDTYRWPIHKTVRMIFLEGKSHRMTPQYEDIMSALEANGMSKPVWGCESEEDVDALFHRMIAAFEDMLTHGYKTQTELGKHNRDEIQIYITESGQLLKGVGGNHRILMAEIAGIEWLPIVIHGASLEFVVDLCKKNNLSPHRALNNWVQNSEQLFETPPTSREMIHRQR
jgi:hypothetical protein